MPELSRRGLLKMGAFSGAAVSAVAWPATAQAQTTRPTTQPTQTIEMTVTQLRSLGGAHRSGAGDPISLHGTLVSGSSATGDFLAHGTGLGRPNRTHPRPVSMQTQLFTLGDGTITGMGTVDNAGDGTFTITGGTGRYAHVRGSYTSSQHPNQTRGGSGRFVFTFHH
ncbi:MAG: hypothetical protein JWN95_1156 [Frankiales bacterium]|nr:hypothetical protein [Frankiales bacterium]